MWVIERGYGPTIQPGEFARISDYICYGEGDEVVTEIGRAVDSGKSEKIRDLKNIGFIGSAGSLVLNQPAAPIDDLDKLPYPDLSIEDHYLIESDELKKGTTSTDWRYHVLATRGCPFSCSYCMAGQWNSLYKEVSDVNFPKVRQRSPESIVGEIKNAVKVLSQKQRLIKGIQFEDSCFPHKGKWVDEFCRLYRAEIGLPFFCNIEPRYHPIEAMEKIYEAGCRGTAMGIQCGNEDIRERVFNRRIKNDRLIEHAMWIYRKKDMSSEYDILGFNPFETEESLHETFELLCQFPPLHLLNVYRMRFFPESPLGKLYEKEKPQGLSDDHHRTWAYLWQLASKGGGFQGSCKIDSSE